MTVLTPPAVTNVPKCKTANEVASSVLDLVIAEVKKNPSADAEGVKASLFAAVESELNGLRNLAFASGFQSGKANILNLAK